MKMWKKLVSMMLCVVMLTAVAGAVAEDFVAPSVEEVVATVDEAVNNLVGEGDAKDKIMQKLQEKIAHTGDAMMSMKFSLSLNMDMMGQSQAIAIDATVNAISSGMKAIQIYGNAEMTADGETQNALLDGYLMQEDEKYAMYMKDNEGNWSKQAMDMGETMGQLEDAVKVIEENGAFTIAGEPYQGEDGLHFQAYIDLAKILEAASKEQAEEINEAADQMMPGVDVAAILAQIKPIDVQFVCDENYDPKSIVLDAKEAVQTLMDVIIQQILVPMMSSMAEGSEEAEQVDPASMFKFNIDTCKWSIYDIQTLPAGSVIIELPEEAKTAVEQPVNVSNMDIDAGF